MTAVELLGELNELDEHPSAEAKRGLGKSTLETVCAFANEPRLGGGFILFGLARSEDLFGPRYEVVGVSDPDNLQSDLASQCASVFNRPLRPRTWVEVVDDKPVVGAFIPESRASDKPVYIQARGLPQGAFRRIGSSDQRCTEDDLLVLFEGRQRHTFDRDPVPEADFAELDADAIADYRRERARTNPHAEELTWSDEDLLVGIGCAVRNDGRTVPTVAGVLLFGSRLLLRRLFPMIRLDYIRVPGNEWIEDPERRFETIDMRDPIVRLIRRGEAAILDDLPRRFHLPPGELQRRDVPRIPERVVREAVVNALMHRSYRRQEPTQIIRYSNRIEIRNPGHSLKAEDRLGEPGSETRNPAIAAVLHETDFAETKGSGIRVMRRLMREMDLAPPTFDSDRSADEFLATLFLHNLLDDDDLAWLAAFGDLNLGTDEMRALVHVREAGRITNAVYRDLSGVDTLEASAHLRRLRDLGLLKQHDRGAATFYTPTTSLLDATPVSPSELAEQPHKLPEQRAQPLEKARDLDRKTRSETEKPYKEPEKPHNEAEKPYKEPEKPGKETEKPGKETEKLRIPELPPELAAAVSDLKNWAPQMGLRRLIWRLCLWRPMTADELSLVLGRSRGYLRSTYIGPMVKADELEYTNPANPRDPKQRYRASEEPRA